MQTPHERWLTFCEGCAKAHDESHLAYKQVCIGLNELISRVEERKEDMDSFEAYKSTLKIFVPQLRTAIRLRKLHTFLFFPLDCEDLSMEEKKEYKDCENSAEHNLILISYSRVLSILEGLYEKWRGVEEEQEKELKRQQEEERKKLEIPIVPLTEEQKAKLEEAKKERKAEREAQKKKAQRMRKKEEKRERKAEEDSKEKKAELRALKEEEALKRVEQRLLTWRKPEDTTSETLVEKIVSIPDCENQYCIGLNTGTDEAPNMLIVFFDEKAVQAYKEMMEYWRHSLALDVVNYTKHRPQDLLDVTDCNLTFFQAAAEQVLRDQLASYQHEFRRVPTYLGARIRENQRDIKGMAPLARIKYQTYTRKLTEILTPLGVWLSKYFRKDHQGRILLVRLLLDGLILKVNDDTEVVLCEQLKLPPPEKRGYKFGDKKVYTRILDS